MLNFYPNDPRLRFGIYFEFGSFFEGFDDPVRRVTTEACAGFDGSQNVPSEEWNSDSMTVPSGDDREKQRSATDKLSS
jgi:hypothetical protein